MIPKEVTEAVKFLENYSAYMWEGASLQQIKIIKSFLETTDRYVRDLEQHVDDLAAGMHGVMEDD